jgi:hypothetical protein
MISLDGLGCCLWFWLLREAVLVTSLFIFRFYFYLLLFGALVGLVGAGDTTRGSIDRMTITEGIWDNTTPLFGPPG